MFEDLNYTPVSVAQRDRRYGNPQQQKLDKARKAAFDSHVLKPDNRLLRSRAWEPLFGSKPVTLMDRTGCAFPVLNGSKPQRYCNMDTEHGSYCREHAAMMRSKEKSE